MAIKCFEDDYNGGWWCDGCGPNGDLWHHWVGDPQTQAGADASCQNAFTAPGGQPNELAPMNKIRERGVDNSRRYPIFRGGKGKPKKQARRKMQFGGMNPVRQRSISVNPSQGGFFAVPQDERNFGQQSALPYDQQLNFNHRNASGYSNFNQECTQDSHCDFDSICSGHGGFYGGGCVDNNCVAECMDRVAILENCPKPKRQIIKRRRR